MPTFLCKEDICNAIEQLYCREEISLYDKGKAVESDFLTEEINWSEFEDKTVEQIFEK